MRTFSLNSREFYEAVRGPRTRAWIPNGALPPEPRLRDPEVIYERSQSGATGEHGDRVGTKRREPGKAKGKR